MGKLDKPINVLVKEMKSISKQIAPDESDMNKFKPSDVYTGRGYTLNTDDEFLSKYQILEKQNEMVNADLNTLSEINKNLNEEKNEIESKLCINLII
jgi:hypothetical protein